MLDRRHFLHDASLAALFTAGGRSLADEPVAPDWPKNNPFLLNNFAPVAEEVVEDNLRVVGKLPKELEGTYLRNGPNPQFPPKGQYHWFDGDGMVHAVGLSNGKATYRNRFILSDGLKKERAAGKALYAGLAAPPDLKALMRGKLSELYKNAGNTNLVRHNGELLALYEAGQPTRLKLPQLSTKGVENFGGGLKHNFTAHPKTDPKTGVMIAFGYQPVKPYVRFSLIDAEGKLEGPYSLDMPDAVMMHDFAVTERFIIFPAFPMTFSLTRAVQGGPMMMFEKELPSRFYLVDRKNLKAKPKLFEAASCFAFHAMNAWDEGNTVTLVMCRYPEFPGLLASGGGGDKVGETKPVLYRWQMDLKSGKIVGDALEDEGSEFPVIDATHTGKPIRFGYCGDPGKEMFAGVKKFDFKSGTFTKQSFGEGLEGGESVFVKRADSMEEDAGWLLSFVYEAGKKRSELWVGDAQAGPKDKPVARVIIPRRIPWGFHGLWVPA